MVEQKQNPDVEMTEGQVNERTILLQQQEDFYEEQYRADIQVREQSETLFLKRFNNFIKAVLIQEFSHRQPGLSVLDFCCGKGGDLPKWSKAQISHYVGSDLSGESVKEAHARHKELMRDKRNKTFPAIFIVADASSTENPIDKILYQAEKSMRIRDKIVFDIVSAQFSIHYMFYEENNLKGFFKNVTDRLVDGGVFIATTIDSDRLMYQIRENGPKLNISNDHFSVVQKQDTFPASGGCYGKEYYFYLNEAIGDFNIAKNQPTHVNECLCFFSTMEKIALQYNLVLEKKTNFHQYYEDKTQDPSLWEGTRKFNQTLFKSMVMRNVQHMTQDQIEQQWDICGLYTVLVFRKRPANVQPGYRAPTTTGRHKNQREGNNFGNMKLIREVIDEENF